LDKWVPSFDVVGSTRLSPSSATSSPITAKKSLAVKIQGLAMKQPEEFISALKVTMLPHLLEQLYMALKVSTGFKCIT
jgi:hypothetical protein